jgi:hypothetical protein
MFILKWRIASSPQVRYLSGGASVGRGVAIFVNRIGTVRDRKEVIVKVCDTIIRMGIPARIVCICSITDVFNALIVIVMR